MIENDQQLQEAVLRAGQLLQEIHDYTGHSPRSDARIRFPRGVMRPAQHFRNQIPSYVPDRQLSSCAYGLMFTDVLWWLTHRTDIAGVGKDMAFKSIIITVASVMEMILTIPGEGIFDSKAGLKPRLERAFMRGWCNEADRDVLKRLWDDRCNVHLKLLDSHEFGLYSVARVDRPVAALKRLIQRLKEEFG